MDLKANAVAERELKALVRVLPRSGSLSPMPGGLEHVTDHGVELTPDMQRVVLEQRLGFVATVTPDGRPNLSPKGTTTVWDDHHGDGRLGLICAAPAGVQEQVIDEEPERFYVPAYVGHRGWIGVRLDRGFDRHEIAGILEDAYAEVAPPRLVEAAERRSR